MNALTLPRYLLGSREAIRAIASSRWSLVAGALFVLSAGLAREYDGEDLLHQPWHAFRPMGASLVTGTALFLIVHSAALLREGKGTGSRPPYGRAWVSFMGLFWMTAPMAWLYAVPYERFMSPVQAITMNLWTLAFVAAWRVLLMVRVIGVVYGIGPVLAFFLVMVFADALVIVVLQTVPRPVIDVMGGIRHSDRDALIANVTLTLLMLSILSAPIWLIGALIATGVLRPRWMEPDGSGDTRRPRGLLILAGCSVLAFTPLLIMSQPEQIRQRKTEALLLSGEVTEAFALMSARSPGDYPPHWNPPPKVGYRETSPDLGTIRQSISDHPPAAWVTAIYTDKIDRLLRDDVMPYWSSATWPEIVDAVREQGSYFEHDPDRAATAAFLIEHHAGLNDADRDALRSLAKLSSPATPDPGGTQPD